MGRTNISRVELVWPGKYHDDGTLHEPPRGSFPLRVEERLPGSLPQGAGQGVLFGPDPGPPEANPAGWRNRLLLGDNLAAMGSLVDELRGQVDLIYIDPPFGTGSDFSLLHTVGDGVGEAPMERVVEETAYRDRWRGGLESYLPMMYHRLRLMHELLAETGSFYLHVDATVGHYLRPMLDEIFGPGCYQREIVWRIGWVSGYKSAARNWIRNHDTLFFYVKTPGRFTFNKEYVPYPPGYRRRSGSKSRGHGYPIDDVWNANPFEFALHGDESLDSIQIKSFSREKTGYATQKNESLLRRIIHASSNPGDLVADLFCGSGTTAVAAEQLGRRWVACDCSHRALHIARKRLVGLDHCRPFDLLTLQAPRDEPPAPPEETPGEPCLQVQAATPQPHAAVATLCDYAYPHPERLPAGVREHVRHWPDLIDYWAVDWNYDGKAFSPEWASFRTRTQRALRLSSNPHCYDEPGTYRVMVQVVDIVGTETREVVEVDVR